MKIYGILILTLIMGSISAMDKPSRTIKATRPAVQSDPYSIFKAAERGNLAVIRKMIADRVDLNQVDKLGDTPLIIAAKNGRTDVMDALIGAGAKLDVKNHGDNNAMFAAVRQGQVESVRTLLKAGVSPNQREEFGLGRGLTLLMIATQNQNDAIVELLVKAGADTDVRVQGIIPAQQRTAGSMAESLIGGEEIRAYTTLKKEKIP